MKIAVIGGAGVRVPLLINGLANAGLAVDEFALFDLDGARLRSIAELSRRRAGGARVTTHSDVAPAVDGARFVITLPIPTVEPTDPGIRSQDETEDEEFSLWPAS